MVNQLPLPDSAYPLRAARYTSSNLSFARSLRAFAFNSDSDRIRVYSRDSRAVFFFP
jgi:hypothetical protein